MVTTQKLAQSLEHLHEISLTWGPSFFLEHILSKTYIEISQEGIWSKGLMYSATKCSILRPHNSRNHWLGWGFPMVPSCFFLVDTRRCWTLSLTRLAKLFGISSGFWCLDHFAWEKKVDRPLFWWGDLLVIQSGTHLGDCERPGEFQTKNTLVFLCQGFLVVGETWLIASSGY